MCRRLLMLTAVGLAALATVLVTSLAAAATPPLGVHFDVPTTLPPDGGPTFGPFTATGPAVDAGLICPKGDTIDVFSKASGFQSNRGVNFQVVKHFTCADGSGEFDAKLQVRIDPKGDNFNWAIVGGTLAYERLHGTGQGIGEYAQYGVLDLYDGQVHVD